MRMTVQFQNGSRAEALLLAAQGNRIRAIVAGRGTTEEWLMFDGHWFDESGRLIEIEALTNLDGIDGSQLFANVYARTATACAFPS
jgi:hypothetical protein